jgi:hypothetical protein
MNRSAALNARPKGNAAKPAMKVQKISKKNSDPPLKANSEDSTISSFSCIFSWSSGRFSRQRAEH